METEKWVNLLKSQVSPAIGCTEPVAVAIAVVNSYKQIEGEILKISIETSLNIYKNGMRVGIPGTDDKGIAFASALAIVCGEADAGLEVFKNVDADCVEKARKILASDIIDIKATDKEGDFYIHALVESDSGQGECTIRSGHTNIVSIKKNKQAVFENAQENESEETSDKYKYLNISSILEFAETANPADLSFLIDGVKMNMNMANIGSDTPYSSGLGNKLFSLIHQKKLSNDISNKIRAITAAACDARMAGVKVPVMSSAGSGNHGITAILPVAIVARELDKSDEELERALVISHLITAYIKQHTGTLSPICGCAVAAGIGASTAITWLLGGKETEIECAINNMIGSLAGMICDGAKGSCSYKVATAACEAYYQALMAKNNISIENFDGIIGHDAEESIRNLGIISQNSLKNVDSDVIDILSSY